MPNQTPSISPEHRLTELGLTIPEPATPVAAYVPAVRVGDLVYISGQLPMVDGQLLARGRVPNEVSVDKAVECARVCALNGLAAIKKELGSLDEVRRIVRIGCFVACPAGFADQPKIANGASELLAEVFGEAGRHARAAVGSVSLPLNAPVEIEFIVQAR